MIEIIYENISAFHPGYYIKDLIEELEMTQEEFAKRLDITAKNLSDLVNGKAPLSKNIAIKLSTMIGTSVDVWVNLQKTYESKLAEIEKIKSQKEEEKNLVLIDYSYFVTIGAVKRTTKKEEKIAELCKFFKVSSLSVLKNENFFASYRQSERDANDEKRIINVNAWIQTAINYAEKKPAEKFNETKLINSLIDIRNMTVQPPEIFYPQLEKKLADCGVTLVLLPSLKNSGIYGAVKWLNKDKVLLGITDRGKNLDTFWFSLFHELGHILLKEKNKVIVNTKESEDSIKELEEKKADFFSREFLIPLEKYNEFINKGIFTDYSIKKFAKELGIHPAIVVGRLQKDTKIGYNKFNYLKTQYEVRTI